MSDQKESERYDLVVVGGGSAAFAAALKVSELGGRAAIVNAGPNAGGLAMGGTCVNVGCIPSKTMIRAGEAVHRARATPFEGVSVTGKVTDFAAVTRQTQTLVDDLRQSKYADVVADDPPEVAAHPSHRGRRSYRRAHRVFVRREHRRPHGRYGEKRAPRSGRNRCRRADRRRD